MRRILDVAFLTLGGVAFVAVMLHQAARGHAYDLAPLSVAGRLVATKQVAHLYAQDSAYYNVPRDAVFDRAAADVGYGFEPTPFVYPPLVAVLMQPLARLPFHAIEQVWAVLSIGLMIGGLWLTLGLYQPDWRRLWIFGAILIALCLYEPIRYSFWLGQTTAIIFPLVVGALALQRRRRFVWSGLALAIAIFVKLTPAVVLAPWLWRGPRRAAWWSLGWLGALWTISIAAAGLPLHQAYVARVALIGRHLVVAYNNHSLIAWLSRPLYPTDAWFNWRMYEPSSFLTALNAVVLVALVVAAVVTVRRIPPSEEDRWRPTAESFAFLLMLVAPNVSWTHYFVFLLPPIAVLCKWVSNQLVGARFVAGAAFVWCCRPVLMAQDAPDVSQGLLRVGLPTLALLTVWGALCGFGSQASPQRFSG